MHVSPNPSWHIYDAVTDGAQNEIDTIAGDFVFHCLSSVLLFSMQPHHPISLTSSHPLSVSVFFICGLLSFYNCQHSYFSL